MTHSRSLMAILCLACSSIPQWVWAEPSPRIISVGGALTEIVYQLGAEKQLVGVDTTSLFPPQATQLPKVGYQRALSSEGLLSLNPDIVLVTDQAGPTDVLEQVGRAGLTIQSIPVDYSPEGVANTITTVAAVIGETDKGTQLATTFLENMQHVQQDISKAQNRPNAPPKKRVLFLLGAGKGAPLAAGQATAADAMIRLVGAENVMQDYEGYKPISPESLVAANPEAIFLPNRTLEGVGGVQGLLSLPGIKLTKAGQAAHVFSMESLYLLGFTPRLPEAVRELFTHLSTPPVQGQHKASID